MPVKLNQEKVIEAFRMKGLEVLGQYQDSRTPLAFRCNLGHEHQISWDNFKKGTGCAGCTGRFVDWQHEIAGLRAEGYRVEDQTYQNRDSRIRAVCPNGHPVETTLNLIKKGHRCKACAGQVVTFEQVRDGFEQEGYTLLATAYKNNHTKLPFVCPQGHQHQITWQKFRDGYRCAVCAGNARISYGVALNLFAAGDYELISDKESYRSGGSPCLTVCPNGHDYRVTPVHFKEGYRCRVCYVQNNRGKNHPNWRHDLSDDERRQDRNLMPGYWDWRLGVYRRDSFTCQCCGDRGIYLHAHHLYSYKAYPELRLELSNGITLCKPCHRAFHKSFGNRDNTPEQFQVFRNEYDKNQRNFSSA